MQILFDLAVLRLVYNLYCYIYNLKMKKVTLNLPLTPNCIKLDLFSYSTRTQYSTYHILNTDSNHDSKDTQQGLKIPLKIYATKTQNTTQHILSKDLKHHSKHTQQGLRTPLNTYSTWTRNMTRHILNKDSE